MVSIPDWSKFGRLHETPKEVESPQSKYYKQRAQEVIKHAEEQGYFLNPSRSYIEDQFLDESEDLNERKYHFDFGKEKNKDLSKIKLIKLVDVHLRTLGDIGLCTKLRICVLSNNYITRFDALADCRHLLKLDLHKNQISMVPGVAFWAGMKYLRMLHLHDNPIGKIDNLHYLAACPNLTGLTLYDSPLSIKRNYRHHVVNSIWSLKALDNFVISDEEIIEDADFGGQFASFHPSFAVHMNPSTGYDGTYDEELSALVRTLSDINQVLARNSPVLIIQRWVRGHQIRKKFKIIQDTRIWAAVTIQRTFRAYKGYEKPSHFTPKMPSQAPISPSNMAVHVHVPPGTVESLKMDFDTYMNNRRPGSTAQSEISVTSRSSRTRPLPNTGEVPSQSAQAKAGAFPLAETPETIAPRNSAKSPDQRKRKNLFINLAKLQAGTLQSLQDEAITVETIFPTEMSFMREDRSRPTDTRRSRKKVNKEAEPKKRMVKNVKQFFGPVVDNTPTPDMIDYSGLEDEELPMVHFRLRGLKQHIKVINPTADMMISRREVGKDIRAAEAERLRREENAPKPSVKKKQNTTNDQRFFSRVQGTMGLSCLQAVQQAYRDREKAERRVAKMEYIMSMKEQRDQAKERIRIYQEDKRHRVIKDREQEKKRVMEILQRHELQQLNYVEKNQESRNKTASFSRHKRGEFSFVSDFNIQNTSVSNALKRHDRLAKQEDREHSKGEFVKAQKEMEMEQQSIVAKYLEHRQLMRQTETAMQRAALDTKMLQEANERLIEARQRKEQLRARNATVKAFYPLPTNSTHSLPPLSDGELQQMHGLDRWHTNILMTTGRVGRHPTTVSM